MRRSILIIILIFAYGVISQYAYGETVTLKAVSSGIYEDGEFVPTSDRFEAKYVVNKEAGVIKTKEVIHSDREGRIEEDEPYEIVDTVLSGGLSGLTVSGKRKGQEIITGVRDVGLGAAEIIIVGKDFYEYCRAANGKIYLESGEVVQSVQ